MNFKEYFYLMYVENTDYRGEHTAPDRDTGSPLHDVTTTAYPKDFYDSPASWYASEPADFESHNIIKMYKNKPNKTIKIYRAVPDFNKDLDSKIKEYSYPIWHRHNSFGKTFPMMDKSPIMRDLREKFKYDDDKIEEWLEAEIKKLEDSKQLELKILPGDWVTISKEYAKEHGQAALRNKFKILSKTVKAHQIYNSGDSLSEWGYDP